LEADARINIGSSIFYGDAPLDDVVSYMERLPAQMNVKARGRSLHGLRGQVHAMRGQFDTARKLIAETAAVQEDFGNTFRATLSSATGFGVVEMLAGNPVAAEEYLSRGYEVLKEAGVTGFLSTVAANLANALYVQGRFQEAEQYTRISEDTASRDDYLSQILWRSVRAKVIASEGRLDEAERLAREAVMLAEDTDNIDLRGNASMALAAVLRLAERPDEAAPLIQEALRLYEQKGNLVSAGKARALLGEVQKRSAP